MENVCYNISTVKETTTNTMEVNIMNTYECYVMMDNENGVITEEYDTPEQAIEELKEKYTIEEMHENGFTCNKLLCEENSWLECLEEIEY